MNIGTGKTLIIRLLYVSDQTDDSGNRTVYFRLNGQTRSIEIQDRNANIRKISNEKISGDKHIGAPLQGRISKIFIKNGDHVKKNTPLFTIEAMKMETTITASRDMIVSRIALSEATMVEADDLVVEVE